MLRELAVPKSDHKDDDVTPLIIASHRATIVMPEYSSVQHKKNGKNLSSHFFSAEKGLHFREILPCDVDKQIGTVSRMLKRDIVAYSLSRLVPTQIARNETERLHWLVAAHHCHLRVVQILSTAKADMDKPMAGGLTPLIVAAHGGQVGDSHSQTSMILLAAVLVTRLAELCPVCLVHHLCFVLARDLVSW